MRFAVAKTGEDALRDRLAEGIVQAFVSHGHELAGEDDPDVRFVLNLADAKNPRPYRRRSRAIFVATLVADECLPDSAPRAVYTLLVHSLSNLALFAVPKNGGAEVHFSTLESGFYRVPYDPEALYQRIAPLASSRLLIENDLEPDLPEAYWRGSPITEELIRFGREMDLLGVLPAPFPLQELLEERDLRHVYRLYGLTGLSYGNLGAREDIPELGPTTFWITARGVDKSALSRIGKDVVLVKGFDSERSRVIVSVPPDHDPKARASVDAIEHYLIYASYPDVRAIVHLHAWMDEVLCTHQNYPCGTRELAEEVVDLLSRTSDPSRAVVGLKNHGLTITGHSLADVFGRITGRLLKQVPMTS
jgi:ribulose-5-phosphate 4-epimerase/fuculose-1-phosphate aldolase